jgi:DNA-binding NarL/FixJ family response regulator
MSASRSTAGSWWPRRSPAPGTRCARAALARGDALVDPETTVRLIASVTRSFPAVEPSDGLAGLGAEERVLLAAIARGGSNAEIGASADEVAALLAKLGVRERIRAVMLAHEARMTG